MEQSEYHGFLRLDFEYQGREVIVVCPKQRAAGNPWVWRAEFFGAFDTVDVEMLNRGSVSYTHLDSELQELADYITEMTLRRHPYDRGIMARKGIEY